MLLNLLQGDFDFFSFLTSFLTSLPAFVVALTFHEAAHAYAAWRCGDPTARMMGRLTLNPLRHLDPMGFLFMFVAGVGWAKPVPVNPNNFKNPRKNDFMVSIAGITMNLMLCVLSSLAMYAMVTHALSCVPAGAYVPGGYFQTVTAEGAYLMDAQLAYELAPAMQTYLIAPFLGEIPGYIFQFFVNLAVVDLSLALFNLLPVPPLDGYHVFNDLLFKGSRLFASPRVQQIGMLAIVVLMFTGVFGKALSFLVNGAFDGMGQLFYHLAAAAGAA